MDHAAVAYTAFTVLSSLTFFTLFDFGEAVRSQMGV